MSKEALLATWNVNSIRARVDHVLQWVRESKPDLLALQELKVESGAFPAEPFEEAGYLAYVHGQKTWNGVAFLSRGPLSDVERGIPELEDDTQARILSATWRGVRVFNLYVPNGQEVGSGKYVYKLEWLRALYDHISSRHKPGDPLVLVGDFNIAPEDRDIHDPEGFRGQVLFSDAEHEALGRLMDWGFTDVLRLHHGGAGLYSWWDYRQGAFRRNLGARIDLILATKPAADGIVSSGIDIAPRKWERPSDHAPVMARFRADSA